MSDSDIEDFAALMEEPPGGLNYGRRNGQSLNADDHRAYDSRFAGGFGIADIMTMNSEDAGGLTTHRTVVHQSEFIDDEALLAAVEEKFGFTKDQIARAYTRGRPAEHTRQLRDKIDARLLALRRSGANMDAFRKIVGLDRKTMDRAVARAAAVDS